MALVTFFRVELRVFALFRGFLPGPHPCKPGFDHLIRRFPSCCCLFVCTSVGLRRVCICPLGLEVLYKSIGAWVGEPHGHEEFHLHTLLLVRSSVVYEGLMIEDEKHRAAIKDMYENWPWYATIDAHEHTHAQPPLPQSYPSNLSPLTGHAYSIAARLQLAPSLKRQTCTHIPPSPINRRFREIVSLIGMILSKAEPVVAKNYETQLVNEHVAKVDPE